MTGRLVPAPPRSTTPRRRPAPRAHLIAASAAVAVRPGETFTFLDLVQRSGQAARPSELMDWLAEALSSGRAVALGFRSGPDGLPVGPRRYRLR